MIIGIPKEIKVHEYRVGATPEMVGILIAHGHRVVVETKAGARIGFSDEDYRQAGASVVDTAKEVYQCEMIVKVKELQSKEFELLHEDQIIFCYLHLAPDPVQTKHLLEKKVIAVAYETITDKKGRLPLLLPMSEIAGRIAIQAGATLLQLNHGGKGLLLGGVPGVLPASVVVVGGGILGTEAARMAMGLGAIVTVLDKDLNRLRELDHLFGPRLHTVYSTPAAIEECVIGADLVIGAVLIPGKTAPKLITRAMVEKMTPGSVIIDAAIDQGGCTETSRPTTHAEPSYEVNGVIHYCVTNMPGACARTATLALTHATADYVLALANKGVVKALRDDPDFKKGLNVFKGHVTNAAVAADLGYAFLPPDEALAH